MRILGRIGASVVLVAMLSGFGGGALVSSRAPAANGKLPRVTLLAPPKTGAGLVPTFKWKAVKDAALYELAVIDRHGKPVWAWQGAKTKVNLGGLPGKRPTGAPGPVITKGDRWFVAALDSSGAPIAFSGLRPVSP